MEKTLAIIKPDTVGSGRAGKIFAHLETEGFRILATRKMQLSTNQARAFYEVHKDRPFYDELVAFMTSGPVMPIALERDNAVKHLREVMGATNPADAAEGTIRALHGSSIEKNGIHGSDSPENAAIELNFFFPRTELIGA